MSQPMKPDDPAYWMLFDGFTTTPTVNNPDCYICNDPEFAQMGLPLCYPCIVCGAHVAADDTVCDKGHQQPTDSYNEYAIRKEYDLEITDELKELAIAETEHMKFLCPACGKHEGIPVDGISGDFGNRVVDLVILECQACKEKWGD